MRYAMLLAIEEREDLSDEDLDEAIEIASRNPAARYGTIEVRPVWEIARAFLVSLETMARRLSEVSQSQPDAST